jgi:hypothetical protein
MDASGVFLKDEMQKFMSKLPNAEMKEAERVFLVCYEKGMYTVHCIMHLRVMILTYVCDIYVNTHHFLYGIT